MASDSEGGWGGGHGLGYKGYHSLLFNAKKKETKNHMHADTEYKYKCRSSLKEMQNDQMLLLYCSFPLNV